MTTNQKRNLRGLALLTILGLPAVALVAKADLNIRLPGVNIEIDDGRHGHHHHRPHRDGRDCFAPRVYRLGTCDLHATQYGGMMVRHGESIRYVDHRGSERGFASYRCIDGNMNHDNNRPSMLRDCLDGPRDRGRHYRR